MCPHFWQRQHSLNKYFASCASGSGETEVEGSQATPWAAAQQRPQVYQQVVPQDKPGRAGTAGDREGSQRNDSGPALRYKQFPELKGPLAQKENQEDG